MTDRITSEQTINGYRIRRRGEDVLIDRKETGYECIIYGGSYDEEVDRLQALPADPLDWRPVSEIVKDQSTAWVRGKKPNGTEFHYASGLLYADEDGLMWFYDDDDGGNELPFEPTEYLHTTDVFGGRIDRMRVDINAPS